jgi:hypothetical protein
MSNRESHPSYQVLVMAADNELSGRQAEQVRAHLGACWTCRSRMREIEAAIADFIAWRQASDPKLPPPDGPRAALKVRLALLASAEPAPAWRRFLPALFQPRSIAPVMACILGILIALVAPRFLPLTRNVRRTVSHHVMPIPDPRLTPGATLPLTKHDVCGLEMVESARIVPPAVAKQVFAAYGIENPAPRAYEVDYLITPALGGSDNIRNFWPQPYAGTEWNANVKDALEDRMRALVCGGKLDLSTAQSEIARDWVGAYKKYFDTDRPLTHHLSFLKDRPWE